MGLTTNSPDSAHFPPNSPDKLCASPRAAPTATENSRGPATSRPPCPVRVPGRRSLVGVASLCPNHRQGARVVEAAPNRGPDSSAPDGVYLLTWPGRCPGVPHGKAVPLPRRQSPNSPRN